MMKNNNGTRRAMPSRMLTTSFAAALAAGALAAPGASGQPADPVNQTHHQTAADHHVVVGRGVDLRSPDAIAAGESPRPAPATPAQTPVRVVEPGGPSSGGFAWGDAAIGAGGAVGTVVLAFGGAVALTRRRNRPTARAAA
jgi:hypothetical protein